MIKDHCNLYQRAIRHMLLNPKEYNIERDTLQCLYKQLNELEAELLTGNIVQVYANNAIFSCYTTKIIISFQSIIRKCLQESLSIGLKNCSLSNEFSLYIQQLLTELERDDEHVSFTQIWLQANTLYVFQQNLFGTNEKKMLKRLLEINKKVCLIKSIT